MEGLRQSTTRVLSLLPAAPSRGGVFLLAAGFALLAAGLAAAGYVTSRGSAGAPTAEQRLVDTVVREVDSQPRSSYQDALLADGQLTEAEYDDAFQRYTACAVAAGGEVRGPATKTRWGVYDFSIGVPPTSPGEPNRAAQAAVQACQAQYFDIVGQRWSATHMVPQDVAAAAFAKVPGCMQAGGVAPPANLSQGWSLRYLESAPRADGLLLMECVRQANVEMGGLTSTLAMP